MKFLSLGVPIERRTVAPAPSDCSIASKTVRIARGFGEVALSDGSSGGITGRPTKVEEGAMVDRALFATALSELFEIVLSVLDRKNARMYSRRLSC